MATEYETDEEHWPELIDDSAQAALDEVDQTEAWLIAEFARHEETLIRVSEERGVFKERARRVQRQRDCWRSVAMMLIGLSIVLAGWLTFALVWGG